MRPPGRSSQERTRTLCSERYVQNSFTLCNVSQEQADSLITFFWSAFLPRPHILAAGPHALQGFVPDVSSSHGEVILLALPPKHSSIWQHIADDLTGCLFILAHVGRFIGKPPPVFRFIQTSALSPLEPSNMQEILVLYLSPCFESNYNCERY